MAFYFVKRVLVSLPVLVGISVISFLLVRLVPGDTVTAILGIHYDPERAAALRTNLGLDRSLLFQYGLWLKNVFLGNFGASVFTGKPVLTTLLERLPVTLELTGIGLLFSVFMGIPLGLISAVFRGRLPDRLSHVVGLVGISVPNFWLGTVLILLFSLHLGWLPSGSIPSFAVDPVGHLKSLIMPGIALGTSVSAVVMRMSRSSMLEVLRKEYIIVARAKGVSEWAVTLKHALKNAFIPIVTSLGIQVGFMLGGSIIVEQIFSLPGLGQLSFQAVMTRDYLLLQGIIMFVGSAFVFLNLAVDALYAWFDPRIRYQ